MRPRETDGHLLPEDLALVALGESVPGAGHLAECRDCAAEVEALRRVVDVGRASSPGDVPVPTPPPGVWERIASELGLSSAGADESPAESSRPTTAPGRLPPSTAEATARQTAQTAAPATPRERETADDPAGAVVVPLAPRRRRISTWIAASAAAGVLVGAVGGAWWASRIDDAPVASVVAEASLDPLPGWDAAGTAALREYPDGTRVVAVDVDAVLGDDGFREVWLLAPDVSGMVSLGLLEGTSGEFTLPAGVDLTLYPVVDVSEEPFDGNAAHSGNSIVRGELGV